MELTLQKGVEKFRKLRNSFCYFSADNTKNMTVRCSDQGDEYREYDSLYHVMVVN